MQQIDDLIGTLNATAQQLQAAVQQKQQQLQQQQAEQQQQLKVEKDKFLVCGVPGAEP